jgi:hypothetical protein
VAQRLAIDINEAADQDFGSVTGIDLTQLRRPDA